jgi:hypothetical protein
MRIELRPAVGRFFFVGSQGSVSQLYDVQAIGGRGQGDNLLLGAGRCDGDQRQAAIAAGPPGPPSADGETDPIRLSGH